MNRVLLYMEFRRNLRPLIVWASVIVLLVVFTMSFFRTFLQYQMQIAGMVQLVPAVAMKMRGFSNISDIFNVLGFYTANNLIYMMLLGSIYSIVLSSGIVLKEEYGRTAEFLMARPLTRGEIFNTKAVLVFTNVLLLNIVAIVAGFISIEIFRKGEYNFVAFLVISVYTLLLNLFFAAVGLLMSVLMRRARPVTAFSVAVVMVLYFIYTISRMSGIDGTFGYISPFKWVNVNIMEQGYSLGTGNTLAFLGFTVLLAGGAALLYRKRDILI